MNIAIASSGLGHVARGIETWALDTAVALAQLLGCQVAELIGHGSEGTALTTGQLKNPPTLPSGATEQPSNSGTGHEVTLFSGAPLDSFRSQIGATSTGSVAQECRSQIGAAFPLPASRLPLHTPIPRHSDTPTLSIQVLPCLKRGDRTAQQLSNWTPPFLWRWGLKNPYGWEQLSFWLRLWPHLRRGKYDVLHVQDPMVANWCRLFRKWGLVRTKEILAHGTEETAAFLAKFEYVQHLAPWHLSQNPESRIQK